MTKQLNEGFKRSAYWNEYKTKIESKEADDNLTIFYFDASSQGVSKLYVLAFLNTIFGAGNADGPDRVKRVCYRKYFLSRVNITNYNVLIGGKNFYDQPINHQIKKYDEIRKISTESGDDFTTGCLLDCQYVRNHYQLIAVDLSKQ